MFVPRSSQESLREVDKLRREKQELEHQARTELARLRLLVRQSRFSLTLFAGSPLPRKGYAPVAMYIICIYYICIYILVTWLISHIQLLCEQCAVTHARFGLAVLA